MHCILDLKSLGCSGPASRHHVSTATNLQLRLTAFRSAQIMSIAIQGSRLQMFDGVDDNATIAPASQLRDLAMLQFVTIVGRGF